MKEFDLVVFGATSFVGQILSHYLLQRHGTQGPVKWAIAARSSAKLEQLRHTLGASAAPLTLILADSQEEASLQAMCARAKVVVSTVGPYALFGEPLVRACAQSGTDYCDLTGEVQWIRRMLEKYQTIAEQSGARLVNCCGFDSIPSDLGVQVLQQTAIQRFGAPCTEISMRVKAMRGGFSGGTAASLLNVAKEAAADPALRRELANPFSLCPEPRGPRQPKAGNAHFDADFANWTAPFIMAGINTRIVHRSNALQGGLYGKNFCYSEAVLTGTGWRGRLAASAATVGLGTFMLASALPPSRYVLQRFLLPKPGEGPSPEAQRKGFFDLRFFGRTDQGQTLRAKVTGDRDPGYGSTAKMLGEAAVCLASDPLPEPRSGGFWTPASLLGPRLTARLEAHAGLRFEVTD